MTAPDRFALVGGTVLIDGKLIPDTRVTVAGGRIAAVSSTGRVGDLPRIDVGGRVVSPGLIDIHTHGAAGASFDGATGDKIAAILVAQAAHGVLALAPTLVTGSVQEMRLWLERLSDAPRSPNGAQIIGVHLEGPCLNPKQCGAHGRTHLRTPADQQAASLLVEAASPHVLITLAPELPGALELIPRLVRRGAVVAAGHSEATADDVRRAQAVGLSHVVHLWSSQSSVVRQGRSRVPGLLEAALASDSLTAEVIADGKHLPKELLEIALRCVPPERLSVVSDSTAGAGLPEGAGYRLGELQCRVAGGVGVVDGDGSTFAGSTTFLNEMLKVLTDCGVGRARALSMATAVPARVLGLDTKGTIAPGMDADIVVFEDDFSIHRFFVGGRPAEGSAQVAIHVH
jgi:N-acetylglucosamine-6-phosphate deacetylase